MMVLCGVERVPMDEIEPAYRRRPVGISGRHYKVRDLVEKPARNEAPSDPPSSGATC
jgi:UTP-glucose-1-phosphate uridylyltransferase